MEYIIVLGSKNKNIMEKRVKRALEDFAMSPHYYFDPDFQIENPIKALLFSGGSCDGVSKPEASIMMEEYASDINKNYMFTETNSKNTIENLIFCKQILDKDRSMKKLVICTSSSHIKRAMVLARMIFGSSYYHLRFIHTNEPVDDDTQKKEWKSLVINLDYLCNLSL